MGEGDGAGDPAGDGLGRAGGHGGRGQGIEDKLTLRVWPPPQPRRQYGKGWQARSVELERTAYAAARTAA